MNLLDAIHQGRLEPAGEQPLKLLWAYRRASKASAQLNAISFLWERVERHLGDEEVRGVRNCLREWMDEALDALAYAVDTLEEYDGPGPVDDGG